MTQAALATRAGVSRKWLIGLEQGARTGAELGKVLEVLRALNLAIQLSEEPEGPVSRSSQADVEAPLDTITLKPADPRKASTVSTSQALTAIEAMRQATLPSRTVLDAMRQATQLSPATFDAIRQAATSSTTVLDAMRQATQLSPAAFDAIRQAATSSTTVLDAMRQATQLSPAAFDAIRQATQLSPGTLEAGRRNQDEEE